MLPPCPRGILRRNRPHGRRRAARGHPAGVRTVGGPITRGTSGRRAIRIDEPRRHRSRHDALPESARSRATLCEVSRMTGTTQDDYTDRYARRVRGMTTSEIRALFAVASRPEVVSLAGGSPYIAALPLGRRRRDARPARLRARHDHPAVRHRPGHHRAARADLRSDGAVRHRRGQRRVTRRRGGDRRRAAGPRSARPALPGPGRRGARRGADLRRRTRRLPGRPGTGACTWRWTTTG